MSATILEWKQEPASPLLDTERDAWLFFEDDDDITALKTDDIEQNHVSSPTRAEVAQQLLDDIDDYVKKESNESFSDWFEEKVTLPIFEEIPSINEYTKPGLEQDLQEFDYVFNHGQLTPPQSPPTKEIKQPLTPSYEEQTTFVLPDENIRISFQQVFPNYVTPQNIIAQAVVQPVVQPTYITLLPPNGIPQVPVQKAQVDDSFITAPPTPVPDIEKELAVVDEVVRSTAQNLDSNWDQWDSETSHSEASSESFGCSSPQSSVSAEEETDDPEWMPESGKSSPGKASKTSCRSKSRKPYSRSANVEDKRLRKKEQNKNAATRYRQKKKAEVSEILEEEKQLEDINAELEKKVADVQTEIKYLKGLMRDLFKAKGLIK